MSGLTDYSAAQQLLNIGLGQCQFLQNAECVFALLRAGFIGDVFLFAKLNGRGRATDFLPLGGG